MEPEKTSTSETKKRIMTLVERYGSARCLEELAGARDAPPSVLKRHYDKGNEAWNAIGAEIDALLAGEVALCNDCDDPVHDGDCPPVTQ